MSKLNGEKLNVCFFFFSHGCKYLPRLRTLSLFSHLFIKSFAALFKENSGFKDF